MSTRLTAGELVPLADRLRYMFVVRAVLVAGVVLCSAVAPGLVGVRPPGAAAVLFGWTTVSAAAEISRRLVRRRGLPLLAATLIIDGIALVWLSEVGSVTNVRYLIFLHMVAVVLLGSYRTGLKMLLWYTLLLFTVFFGARQGSIGHRVAPGVLSKWDLGQLCVFVVAVWAVAIATAAFSSVNERELRRRRFDLEALAHFAADLEHAADRQAVADTFLTSLADAFPVGRLLLVTAGRRPVVLGQRGIEMEAAVTKDLLHESSALLKAQTSRETLLLSALGPDTDTWLRDLLGPEGNFMMVPLYAEGGCVGVLVAEHKARPSSRVERRLLAIIERFASHTALALRNAALLEQMGLMASTDGLTRIANRRMFEASLKKEIANSVRSGSPVSLIMLDIDNFKVLNDTYGHQAGDEVLREVAIALQASSREVDTVARYGGEEFAVILPGCSPVDAAMRGERLRRLINESVGTVRITVSLGVSTAPTHAETTEELIKAADDALYQAKRSGRDRVRSADAELDAVLAGFPERPPATIFGSSPGPTGAGDSD